MTVSCFSQTFCPKKGRFVTVSCFSQIGLLKPLFLQCFLVPCFWAELSIRVSWTENHWKFWLTTDILCISCFFGGGGLKGQVRWPKGPPHLALNPPYFFGLFGFLFWFCLIFCFRTFKLIFPLERAFLCVFSVSLWFSLLSLPLCTLLSLSLSCSFLSFFLPCFFLFCFLVFLVFISCLVYLVLFHETTTSN